MQCPNCQTENPANAKFCLNCGTALALRCSNCQAELPSGAKFCMNCGQPVTVTAPKDDARLTRLAAAAPAELKNKMRAAHLAGERKMVTALFADVVGSTSLAEQMDAEDWTAVMNRAFDLISPAVYKYEGTIARLLGDAILAFFGAPVAHEDDPVRAIRAGLEVLTIVREYAEEVRRKHGIDFAMRVGLNTGPVVVGEVGSDLKYEYTAMGDAINLRMQSAARPMSLLISEHTHRFVAPVFECVDLGQIDVKGKAERVRVYEVAAAKAAPGKLRGLAGLESPMVGRDAELQSLLKVSAAVQAGLGRAVVIAGEAGLGKTRLLSEWKVATQTSNLQSPNSNIQWAEGHCLSYGQGLAYHLLLDVLRSLIGVPLAYHLLLDVLRSLIGVPAAASEPETHAALKARTEDLFGEAMLDVYPYLGHLLLLQDLLEGAALDRVKALDPQAVQAQYLAAMRKLLQAMAARQPLALICDDIHWADPSSTELFIKLLPLTSEAPVLFTFITRPDREAAGW
ncbi:MAG: Guanylate cyclase protein, partial [Anaerolineales bacterium]|nr:Guanylate cyclase protein [Anaerolineales bacterium]